jgi:hypothetical protein
MTTLLIVAAAATTAALALTLAPAVWIHLWLSRSAPSSEDVLGAAGASPATRRWDRSPDSSVDIVRSGPVQYETAA